MAQEYPDIESTDYVSASRTKILSRDDATKSGFSGTTFPSTDLLVGMRCYRTDLGKAYILTATGPSVWSELQLAANLGTAAAKNTGTSGNNVPLLDGANTWSALQTFGAGAALGTQTLATTGGSLSGDTDLRLNAGSAKDINFLINSVSRMKLYADGGFTVGAPTGNSKGAGTLNAQTLYQNNNLIADAAYRTVGTSDGNLVAKESFGGLAWLNTVSAGYIDNDAVTWATKMAHQTAGQIPYYGGSGVPSLLSIGSEGQYLKVVSGQPAWGAIPAADTGGFTYVGATSFVGGVFVANVTTMLSSGYKGAFVSGPVGMANIYGWTGSNWLNLVNVSPSYGGLVMFRDTGTYWEIMHDTTVTLISKSSYSQAAIGNGSSSFQYYGVK